MPFSIPFLVFWATCLCWFIVNHSFSIPIVTVPTCIALIALSLANYPQLLRLSPLIPFIDSVDWTHLFLVSTNHLSVLITPFHIFPTGPFVVCCMDKSGLCFSTGFHFEKILKWFIIKMFGGGKREFARILCVLQTHTCVKTCVS